MVKDAPVSPRSIRPPADSGFSIVEAMVALAVFAMAGVGLVQLQAQSLRTLSTVETQALASAVAQNELVEIAAARTPPDLGVRTGESAFGGRRWSWSVEVQPAPDPGSSRVSVVVTDARGAVLARAQAFLAAPTEIVAPQADPTTDDDVEPGE